MSKNRIAISFENKFEMWDLVSERYFIKIAKIKSLLITEEF